MKRLDLTQLAQHLHYAVHGLGHYRHETGAIVVAFIGMYRWGGAGHPDALFMRDISALAVECLEPQNLILDLSRLWYQWGDEMWDIVPPNHYGPVALVPGPACEQGLVSLWFGQDATEQVVERAGVFTSIGAARRYLCTPPWPKTGFDPRAHGAMRKQALHLGLRGA